MVLENRRESENESATTEGETGGVVNPIPCDAEPGNRVAPGRNSLSPSTALSVANGVEICLFVKQTVDRIWYNPLVETSTVCGNIHLQNWKQISR